MAGKLALLVQKYFLYKYTSTNTDPEALCPALSEA